MGATLGPCSIFAASSWSLYAADTCASPFLNLTWEDSHTPNSYSHTHPRRLPNPYPQPMLSLDSYIQRVLNISQEYQTLSRKNTHLDSSFLLAPPSSLPVSVKCTSISPVVRVWNLTVLFHSLLSWSHEIHCQLLQIPPPKSVSVLATSHHLSRDLVSVTTTFTWILAMSPHRTCLFLPYPEWSSLDKR